MGYNNANKCIQFLQSNQSDWTNVKILVFDTPQLVDKPYSERWNFLQQSNYFDVIFLIYTGIPVNHPVLSLVPFKICKSRQDLDNYFTSICKDRPTERQAEGIVLKDPTAWYFKVNSFFTREVCIIQLYLTSLRITKKLY
jgi:hypothetical protein